MTLHELLSQQDWEAAAQRLNTAQGRQEATNKDGGARFPVQIACRFPSCPLSLVRDLLNTEAVQAVDDDDGALPIHHLCARTDDEAADVIESFVQAHPDGVQCLLATDHELCTPLHIACQREETGHGLIREGSPAIIRQLLSLAPQAARELEGGDWLPLHMLCRNCPVETDADRTLLLEKVKTFCQDIPEAASVPLPQTGNLPLHCLYSRDRWFNHVGVADTAKALLEAYPQAARTPNKEGNLPLELPCIAFEEDVRDFVEDVLQQKIPAEILVLLQAFPPALYHAHSLLATATEYAREFDEDNGIREDGTTHEELFVRHLLEAAYPQGLTSADYSSPGSTALQDAQVFSRDTQDPIDGLEIALRILQETATD